MNLTDHMHEDVIFPGFLADVLTFTTFGQLCDYIESQFPKGSLPQSYMHNGDKCLVSIMCHNVTSKLGNSKLFYGF